eukprot:TRINITY_DN6941_c0_g3_i1.p1 TRINITY_DN6941_c0_g3~~TRINITY_DN6941_c0_g3_i1.p1  ORF type:complete len:663 (+),score=98.24 TRINITY_DN6941_c0_g3_i1:88-2076(+)
MASGLSFDQLLDQLASLNDSREKEVAELREENTRLKADNSDKVSQATDVVLAERLCLTENKQPPASHCDIDDKPNGIQSGESVTHYDGTLKISAGGSLQVRNVFTTSYLLTSADHHAFQLLNVFEAEAIEGERVRQVATKAKARIILSPNDTRRVIWDVVGMLLLCWDMIAIPLDAFAPEPSVFVEVMDWITQMFWTGDMAMSCLTGYVDEGTVVFEPSKIMLHYLKTWFALDLVVNVPEWITVCLDAGGDGDSSKPTSLLRSMRVVRSVRILRLVKLKRFIAMIKDSISSEVVFIGLNIVKLLSMLILMNHFIAALWYLVGGLGDKDNTWIDAYKMHPGQASLGLRYTTSLHWSLTQFTPASSGIQAQNVYERSFAIITLMMGLVSSSSFISSITGSMSQLSNMNADASKQFWLLRRYLRQQKVPAALSFKVMRYIEYVNSNRRDRVSEGRILILNTLSDELKNQLKWVTGFSYLKSHVVFQQLETRSHVSLTKMVANGLGEKYLAALDYLFLITDSPSQMYFIKEGAVRYMLARSKASDEDHDYTEDCRELANEEYLCEVALWAEYRHIGKAKAIDETQLITIGAEAFVDLVRQDMNIYGWLAPYARTILAYLNDLDDPRWAEISTPESRQFARRFFFARSTFGVFEQPVARRFLSLPQR